MTGKPCNLPEWRLDLPREKGSETSWVSSDEYIEIKSNLRREKVHRANQGHIFSEAILAAETM